MVPARVERVVYGEGKVVLIEPDQGRSKHVTAAEGLGRELVGLELEPPAQYGHGKVQKLK